MTEENGTDQQQLTVISNGTLDHDTHQHSYPSPASLKMLLECGTNSTIERQIQRVLRKHFLEQRPITWKPTRVELVVNTQLTDDFFAIRKRFEKASAGNRCEFEEHFAFLIETDSQCLDICQNGYHAVESAFNVLGHSKGGVYVCKYADVCIRHASVRRTWEGNVVIKMIIFKIVQGKQTAALVRKGPKLQPIAPTPQFTSHSSVITPKETDDLEKQFDQSQIFLYDFEGRETVKRPHHCLPYAIVSWIQDGSQWPANFDDLDTESDILETDTLRVTALTDDPLLQSKLKENLELAEAATRALEHVYEEEPPPPPPPVIEEKALSPPLNTETLQSTTTADNPSITATNGTGSVSSPTTSTDNLSTTSPPPNSLGSSTNDGSTIPPPPPPPAILIAAAKTPAAAVATTIPLAHSAAAVQAAYRQQSSLLGALPNVGGLRAAPGGMYATSGGLANGLTGQIIYGGISVDALRAYQNSGSSPYMFATHGGQQMQQPALYAAQLQAVAQQQQAAQLAAVAQQQQQQQQQQNLLNSVPAGYMLVRTANGGYALLAQSQAAALQAQAQAQAQAQQQYITVNAAGQATATNARVPMAMVGGQGQQIFYQYAGQPTMQSGGTQYIQVPANYAQQQQQPLSTSPALQTSAQYIGASQGSAANSNGSASTPTGSIQGTSAITSPQKQSAASATAAAIQQQQQYQHAQQTQQQQQQQQQAMQGAHGTNVYYAAIAQAQAQLTAQVQAQQQAVAAATLAQQQQQQQQQQFNLLSQLQYANQQGAPQQMYYTTSGGQTIYQSGGQSYVLAPAGANTGASTTTGAPVMYSAGPVLHNGAGQQQSQGQLAYQLAASQGQGAGAAYQMINATSNVPTQASSSAGVVAQQPAQLVQRSTVLPQVRHHPYRS